MGAGTKINERKIVAKKRWATERYHLNGDPGVAIYENLWKMFQFFRDYEQGLLV
jgi:hypothetical protein